MGKEKTEFEEQFVSKTEKAKKLWEKRITENTTVSMESVQWMAQRLSLIHISIKIKRMLMASSTDFKNLWKRYQKEGVSKFISHVRAKFKLAADSAKDERCV